MIVAASSLVPTDSDVRAYTAILSPAGQSLDVVNTTSVPATYRNRNIQIYTFEVLYSKKILPYKNLFLWFSLFYLLSLRTLYPILF